MSFTNSQPFNIIAAPFTLWWAPVATAFPTLTAEPAVAWIKVGASGPSDYTEDGVTVALSQNIERFRFLGSAAPRKVVRTEESMTISLGLADMSLEQLRLALNNNTVGTASSIKTLGLYRGATVQLMALLLRGPSPYKTPGTLQFEVPMAFLAETGELTFQRTAPAAIQLTFEALEDLSAANEAERFGRLRADFTP